MENPKTRPLPADEAAILIGPSKQPPSAATLARLSCFLRHGCESPDAVAHALACGYPRNPAAMQAGVVAAGRMADALRAFAATYIPISDLFVDEKGDVRSATLGAIGELYDVQNDFDLLRSALTAHMEAPVRPGEVAEWRRQGQQLLAFVFETRMFGVFYQLVDASAEFLRCVAQTG